MAERLYSPQQVAELLGVTPDTIQGWVRRGWLGGERLLEGRLVIGESAVARFLKEQGIDIEELFVKSVMNEGGVRQPGDKAEESDASRLPGKGGMPTPPLRGHVLGEAENMPSERRAGHATPDNSALPERPGTPEERPQPQQQPPPPRAVAEDLPAGAVGQVLDAVLKDALKRGAAAIHLDSVRDGLTLRLRVGGRLYEKVNFKPRLPKGMRTSLPALCKRLGGLKPEETARPQSGGFKMHLEGRDRRFRVTSCPTSAGESIVIFLDARQAAPAMGELGFSDDCLAALRRMLAEPAGLILVTAPPQSLGPRLLAALATVPDASERRVALIARRMDYEVPGALLVRPDPESMPLATAIRAVAEQDTDVLLIDNLRDSAAVAAALDAAGERLVLAGLEVRGDGGDPTALADAGADPLALAQSLVGIISAAPLRLICNSCRTRAVVNSDLLRRMGIEDEGEALQTFIGSGCSACGESGYAGETAAATVLAADEEMARLLRRSAGRQAIEEFLRRSGARSLGDAVMEKVLAGQTSLEEAARALRR